MDGQAQKDIQEGMLVADALDGLFLYCAQLAIKAGDSKEGYMEVMASYAEHGWKMATENPQD